MQALARRLGLLGRARRTTIIHFFILCFFGGIGLWFLQLVLLKERPDVLTPLLLWRPVVAAALSLVMLWLSIRRFHDQDRPGWIALVALALGVAVNPNGFGIAVTAPYLPLPPALALLITIAYLVALFLPGTIGPNRYGPDPRGWKSAEHHREQQQALRRG